MGSLCVRCAGGVYRSCDSALGKESVSCFRQVECACQIVHTKLIALVRLYHVV